MEWIALVAWVLTAGGGLVMLTIWLRRGGMRQGREAGRRIRPPLILSHFGLAAAGLVVWIIYVATDSDALTWVALALLAVVAVLGFTMFGIWAAQRQPAAAAAARASMGQPAATMPTGDPATLATAAPAPATGEAPARDAAEQHFPVAVVALHGLLAVATVVLVLLTALGVGD